MALEDGAVLGILLGKLHQSLNTSIHNISSILILYESLRKSRTTLQVLGASRNRYMFHMKDGDDQEKRDKELEKVNWKDPCQWHWGDIGYLNSLYGFDAVQDIKETLE